MEKLASGALVMSLGNCLRNYSFKDDIPVGFVKSYRDLSKRYLIVLGYKKLSSMFTYVFVFDMTDVCVYCITIDEIIECI